jgi:hypothetical protein
MSNDLVKRLREDFGFSLDVTAMEAADRIEALEAALREVKELSDRRSTHPMSSEADYFRIARAALEGKNG